MKVVELSPLAFVARAERMTPGEQAVSMADGRGLLCDGVLYIVKPYDGSDAVAATERDAAIGRALSLRQKADGTFQASGEETRN